MDRSRLYTYSAFAACSAAVIYLTVQVFGTGESLRFRNASRYVPPGYAQLEAVVQDVRRNWMPRDRERALERARQRVAGLQAAMAWVLTRPEHAMFEPVVKLAVDLPLPEARPLLAAVAMTGSSSRRPLALLAVESLAPWHADELADFLREGPSPVKVAALKVCAGRDDRPVAAVLELLSHPEAKVREAALAALPAQPAPGLVRSLMELADAGGPGGDLALAAVARAELTAEIEATLEERLPGSSPAVQSAILDAFARKEGPLRNPQLLWDLARDDGAVEVRAKALHCLELSGSYDPDLVRMELRHMPPRMRYFGARCLLKSGELEGVEILLELAAPAEAALETRVAAEVDALETRVAARKLLEKLTGRPLHHGIPAWKAWYDEQLSLPAEARALPPPPF